MRYQFIVRGSVSEAVAEDLPEMTCTSYPTGGTSLHGPVRDEADISSVLARMLDHGLSVVELRSLPD